MSTFPATIFVNQEPPGESNDPDCLILPDHSIASVRSVQLFFATKPIKSKTKLCIIPNADLLQTPAQNALLKILEEPGENNFIELYTAFPQKLLPTIRSRCLTVTSSTQNRSTSSEKIHPAFTSSVLSDKLLASDTLCANKDEVPAWLLAQINLFHQFFIKDPNPSNQKIIARLVKARSMQEHNVDPKSALDWLFLGL